MYGRILVSVSRRDSCLCWNDLRHVQVFSLLSIIPQFNNQIFFYKRVLDYIINDPLFWRSSCSLFHTGSWLAYTRLSTPCQSLSPQVLPLWTVKIYFKTFVKRYFDMLLFYVPGCFKVNSDVRRTKQMLL